MSDGLSVVEEYFDARGWVWIDHGGSRLMKRLGETDTWINLLSPALPCPRTLSGRVYVRYTRPVHIDVLVGMVEISTMIQTRRRDGIGGWGYYEPGIAMEGLSGEHSSRVQGPGSGVLPPRLSYISAGEVTAFLTQINTRNAFRGQSHCPEWRETPVAPEADLVSSVVEEACTLLRGLRQ